MILGRKNEEEVFIGMDAHVEVAASHSVLDRAGVVRCPALRGTLRAGTLQKVDALERAMGTHTASLLFHCKHACEQQLYANAEGGASAANTPHRRRAK